MCLAVPAQVVALETATPGTGLVDVAGARREVNLLLLDDVVVGDWVLVHVGFALAVIDEEEALRTLALYREIDEEMLKEIGPLAD